MGLTRGGWAGAAFLPARPHGRAARRRVPPWARRPLSLVGAAPRGPVLLWLLACLAGVAIVAAGALAGWWFLPFVAGLGTGLAARFDRLRLRATLPAPPWRWRSSAGVPRWPGWPCGRAARR